MQINPTTFLDDVNDWLLHVTGISQDKLFRGFQSQEVLPADDDYIVYTPISQTRIGTNIATLHAENVDDDKNAPDVNQRLTRIDVQIDCYGENAFDYASAIETFAGSLRCNEWLEQSNMALRVLYANNPMNGTLIDETAQFVPRWIVTLSVEIVSSVTDLIPWIEDANIDPNPEIIVDKSAVKIINVDVQYKE